LSIVGDAKNVHAKIRRHIITGITVSKHCGTCAGEYFQRNTIRMHTALLNRNHLPHFSIVAIEMCLLERLLLH